MEEKKELVSIIMPVYNVREYLSVGIRSVQCQTYATWELILVEDGSTDGSDTECDAWAAKDSRIHVVHGSHAGPAAARNVAIAKAKGAYIYFMDSDDWIESDTLETLLHAIHQNDADIAVCGAFFEFPHRTKRVCFVRENRVLSREEALRWVITGKLPSYLWMLLLRREMVREPLADLPCYEDYATAYKWFAHARRVVLTSVPKYHYIQRQGSILHQERKDVFLLDVFRQRHLYVGSHHLMSESENRANTVRNYLKLAKDFARKSVDMTERVRFVTQVKEAMEPHLPVQFSQLGLKRWLRLKLLETSVPLFVRWV